jgi:XRE family transcriptional regulator, regulator of sulfur utilization
MNKIRELRIDRGLSQAKLAARAELDPSTVNQIERGARDASPLTLRKVAQALEVNLAELIEETDSPKEARRSSPEPSFDDVIDDRRLSRFAEVIIAAADRWREAASSADMDDAKRFGLIDAALDVSDLIGERTESEDWEALTNQERYEIVTAMEKLGKAAQAGLDHLKASTDSRKQEEHAKQRREQIREWTARISA